MSSWRSYGGQSTTLDSATFRNLTTETLSVRGKYVGNFDVSGNLFVNGNGTFDANVFIGQNLDVSLNIHAQDIYNNNTFNNKTYIYQLLDVSGNAIFHDHVYFGREMSNNNLFLYGIDGSGIGLGTINPQATLDICGNQTASIQVYNSKSTLNRNILARNKNNNGVAIGVDSSHAYIEFYKDYPLLPNQTATSPYDALLASYPNGNFVMDTSNQIFMLSRVVINPNDHNTPVNYPDADLSKNIFQETLTIYDSSHNVFLPLLLNPNQSIDNIAPNPYHYGQALSLVSQNNTSNTFLHISAPNQTGMAFSGGPYLLDNSNNRAMGTIGWTTPNQNIFTQSAFQPAEVLVSSINQVQTPFSLGINTYQPETERYLMTINGKTHITNGQLTLTQESPFIMRAISMAPSPYTSGIITGNPSSKSNLYSYNILNTTNGGQTWNIVNLANSIPQGDSLYTSNSENDIVSVFTYDNSFSFFGTVNSFNY